MKIYNSYTNSLEEFKSIHEDLVNIYVCGPTIYSDIHIGNARPIILFDILRNYFEKTGYKVTLSSNVTDIDDKIINRADELGVSEEQLVKENLKAYESILSTLNIKFDNIPKVTNEINQIINFIAELIKNEFAYEKNGNVYFNTHKISEYGKLSGRNIFEQQAGIRIEISEDKLNDTDFILWKKTQKGIKYDSPWSKGRPGWHTECVVMIKGIYNETIDIHGGGVDLKFPHHENENAQALACNFNLANYWIHNGFVNVNDEKMSKSIGNTILVKDILNEYDSNILKLLLIQSNYRAPINITEDFIQQTIKINKKFQNVSLTNARNVTDNIHIRKINDYFNNDINTSSVISYLLQIIKNKEDQDVIDCFKYTFSILNLNYVEEEIPTQVLNLIDQRLAAKKSGDYPLADEIREQIKQLGYEIKDTRNGVECQKI